jgi:2-amino-4-hydroxy-6-hydroxymethyldihydropteridine diphosphokinase
MNQASGKVCILLGSNIMPVDNTFQAVSQLQKFVQVDAASTTWETLSVGSPGPNFLNTALACHTHFSINTLKMTVLREIEKKMGRVRTSDKNAPRTIDLDIIIYNDQVVETNLWSRMFIALPVAELYPDLVNPQTGLTLKQVAADLLTQDWAKPHPEIKPELKV